MPKTNAQRKLARRTALVATCLAQQTPAENLILQGVRGVLDNQTLVASLAGDSRLFARGVQPPEATSEAANFERNLRGVARYGKAMLMGKRLVQPGERLPMPKDPSDRTAAIVVELGELTANQQSALREIRGVKNNQALLSDLAHDDRIFDPSTDSAKGLQKDSWNVALANMKALIATKDPSLNNPFPYQPRYDKTLIIPQDAEPHYRLAATKINSLNSVETGVLRTYRGEATNQQLARDLAESPQLFQIGDATDDPFEQASSFDYHVDLMLTNPVLEPDVVNQEAARREAANKLADEAKPPEQLTLNLSDLDDAATDDLQA